jgi:hypothetical protein
MRRMTPEHLAGSAKEAVKSSRPYAIFFEGVGISEQDCRKHLSALRHMQPHEENVFAHNYLYSCLSILDEKSHGLLTYDSIVLAAASLALTIFSRHLTFGSAFVFAALILSAVASALCLSVIWIYWTETSDFENPNGLFLELLRIRNQRTIAYRLSWCLSQLAMVLLVLGVILERVR